MIVFDLILFDIFVIIIASVLMQKVKSRNKIQKVLMYIFSQKRIPLTFPEPLLDTKSNYNQIIQRFSSSANLKFSLSFLSFLVCRSSEVPFQFATLLNHCLHFSWKTLPGNLESMRPPVYIIYWTLFTLREGRCHSVNIPIWRNE